MKFPSSNSGYNFFIVFALIIFHSGLSSAMMSMNSGGSTQATVLPNEVIEGLPASQASATEGTGGGGGGGQSGPKPIKQASTIPEGVLIFATNNYLWVILGILALVLLIAVGTIFLIVRKKKSE